MENLVAFMYNGFIGGFLTDTAVSPAIFWTLMIVSFVASIVIPYFLGSINSAIIISKKLHGDDIRNHGSGNAGFTNMARTFGKKSAVLTLLGDIIKTFVSVIIGYCFLGYITASIASLFCMLGHMFPIFYRFKGGKGVLVTAAAVLLIDPITAVICYFIFGMVLLTTKYVSLSSIMACLLYPIVLNRIAVLFGNAALQGLPNLIAVIVAFLVVFMHRANIKRILDHEEPKVHLGKKEKN